jgi:chromatin segregation and condensation protein Rec8/ScpA/Scc1 (kleisin family)
MSRLQKREDTMALSRKEYLELQYEIRDILSGKDQDNLSWRIADRIEACYDISKRAEDNPLHHITVSSSQESIMEAFDSTIKGLKEFVMGGVTGEER